MLSCFALCECKQNPSILQESSGFLQPTFAISSKPWVPLVPAAASLSPEVPFSEMLGPLHSKEQRPKNPCSL